MNKEERIKRLQERYRQLMNKQVDIEIEKEKIHDEIEQLIDELTLERINGNLTKADKGC